MQLVLSLSILLSHVLAAPPQSPPGLPNGGGAPAPYNNWQPAGPGDLRSPCPLLNSLANHHFLPHDGRNITIPLLKSAFKKYINVGPDVAEGVGMAALSIVGPHATAFSLEDIDKHNVIEHDGSISRSDYALGDDHDFNPVFFGEAAAYFQKPTIDVTDVAKARLARMTTMKRLNPHFHLTTAGLAGSFVEQSFYLSVFGDPVKGVARSDWVLEWFYEQKLPANLGWTPRKNETNLTTLMAMAKRVMAATPGQVEIPDSFFMRGH